MPKYLKETILAAIGTGIFAAIYPLGHSIYVFVLGGACAAASVMFLLMTLITAITRRLKKKEPSGWLMFAVCDIVLLVTAVIVWNIICPKAADDGANIAGSTISFVTLCIISLLGLLLILEFLAYRNAIADKKRAAHHHDHGENCTCEECTHNRREEQ